MEKYRKLWISENTDGSFSHAIIEVPLSELPENDLLVCVKYSSLNYKDALSALGNKGVTRKYPHTPGIDAAGEIVKSNNANFTKGQKVLVTGFDLGMNTFGGFAEYISVPASWAVPLPENLTLKESMMIGTAGLTATMCVDKIRKNGTVNGKILVTGASGGVGSLAIMLLNKLGYEAIALSRKEKSKEYLLEMGAADVIHNLEFSDRPILKPLYNGVIDTVGGEILSNSIKQILPYGAISICGMAASSDFHSSVFPFILRGISLFGIDSAEAPMAWRNELWHNLANEWKIENLEKNTKTVLLDNIWNEIETISKGGQLGRVLIKI